MKLTAVITIIGLWHAGTVNLPVSVFLGSLPSAEGFVAPGNKFEDSYKDLREELGKNRDFQKVMRLVSTPSEAVLILEVTERGLIDTGIRTSNAVATGPTTAVGTTAPVPVKQLFARLGVRGTDYKLDIDGAAGIRLRTFRNQAKNVLQTVVDWVNANHEKLGTQ